MSDMSTFDNAELLQQALSARRNAYAPYSHFQSIPSSTSIFEFERSSTITTL